MYIYIYKVYAASTIFNREAKPKIRMEKNLTDTAKDLKAVLSTAMGTKILSLIDENRVEERECIYTQCVAAP